jgi:hypothetical protein
MKTVLQILCEMNIKERFSEEFDEYINKVEKELNLPKKWKLMSKTNYDGGFTWICEGKENKIVYLLVYPYYREPPTAGLKVIIKENHNKFSYYWEDLKKYISGYFFMIRDEAVISLDTNLAVKNTIKVLEKIMKLPENILITKKQDVYQKNIQQNISI